MAYAHQRIRKTAASWEFNNYADFKEALSASRDQDAANAQRNMLFSSVNVRSIPAPPVFAENAVKQAVDRIQGTVTSDGDGGGTSKKNVGQLLADVGTLLNAVKGGGYLTEPETDKLRLLLDDLENPYIEGGRFESMLLNTAMMNIIGKVGKQFMDKPQNQEAVFDDALSKTKLPKGWQHVPDNVKGQVAQVNEAMLGITMTPTTKSSAKLRITAPPSVTMGRKNAISNVTLGQLTQGLPQKLFFGTLRYFWYSGSVDYDIKEYLVQRYLRIWKQPNTPYAVEDLAGNIIRATTPRISGFAGQNAPGASDKMKQSKMPGADARDIAVRTWIESKNIPAAQSIKGQLKYGWVGAQ